MQVSPLREKHSPNSCDVHILKALRILSAVDHIFRDPVAQFWKTSAASVARVLRSARWYKHDIKRWRNMLHLVYVCILYKYINQLIVRQRAIYLQLKVLILFFDTFWNESELILWDKFFIDEKRDRKKKRAKNWIVFE